MKIFNFVTSFFILLCIIHLIMETPIPVNALEIFALYTIALVTLGLNLEYLEDKEEEKRKRERERYENTKNYKSK